MGLGRGRVDEGVRPEDYHIVTRNAFNWDSMPNFVIGRSGYDLYLVDTAYRDPQITMVDVTNTGVS